MEEVSICTKEMAKDVLKMNADVWRNSDRGGSCMKENTREEDAEERVRRRQMRGCGAP